MAQKNNVYASLVFEDKFTQSFNKCISAIENNSRKVVAYGKKIRNEGQKITSVGKTMTATLTAGITALGLKCISVASDMTENINKVETVFQDASESVIAWSKTTTEQFGISQNSALELSSLFGDMAVGMDLPIEKAVIMAEKLTGLAGDLASYKNVTIDVAETALKGIFTGEGESLKNLGVVMNDTILTEYAMNQGIEKSYKDFSQVEKVQLRYQYVLEKTSLAQGDFAKTSDSVANQQRILKAKLEDTATAFGTKLLPLATKALDFANNIIDKINSLNDKQQDMIIKIAAVVAIAGPVIMVIGKITTGVGKFIIFLPKLVAGIKTVTVAFSALNLGILPIVLIIGAVVAAGYLLIKNWDLVVAKATDFGGKVKEVFQGIGNGIVGVFNGIRNGIITALNWVIDKINYIPRALNKISIDLPEVLGGQHIGFDIPMIPSFENGTNNFVGGLARTNENGGEIFDLPRGTRIYPHDESVKKAYDDGRTSKTGNITLNIQKLADKLEVRKDSDIDAIADQLANRLIAVIANQ